MGKPSPGIQRNNFHHCCDTELTLAGSRDWEAPHCPPWFFSDCQGYTTAPRPPPGNKDFHPNPDGDAASDREVKNEQEDFLMTSVVSVCP